MIQSRLLEYTKESIAIKFSSYNFMAYFVAIKLSRNLERNPSNLDDLNYIVRNICFGINDTILLFCHIFVVMLAWSIYLLRRLTAF